MKPFVYIASPYTKGDPAINAHFQCKVFDELLSDGIVLPYAPLWTHFQHTVFPKPYKVWVEYDLAILPKFDACLRLTSSLPDLNYSVSESSGADGEVKEFERLGKPVFYSKQDLYDYFTGKNK